MNGKKAKLLRRLAGPKDETKYMVVPKSQRRMIYEEPDPVLGVCPETGKPYMVKREMLTAGTFMLAPGTRALYQRVLKKGYLRVLRSSRPGNQAVPFTA